MEKVIDRFIRYAKEYTTSDPESKTFPSTARQLDFADKLVVELKEIGLQEVEKDANGYVTATLPANTEEKCPVVGFVAHMDTSPDFSGENVKPQIRKYDGGDIVLNEKVTLSPAQFPDLLNYVGQEIITTDGSTLLGADDKAGVAEIMTAMAYLVAHPEIRHGKVRICFTPDEEVGKGADYFDVEKFGAKFAYTLDGGEIGELEYENFNAAMAKVTINGRSVHPGAAKNKMINAIEVGSKLMKMLPAHERPEYTEKYEGFFHCVGFQGSVEQSVLTFIIRDHDKDLFEKRKRQMELACRFLNEEFGQGTVVLEQVDQYYNMREKVEPVKYIVDLAEEAMTELGISPKIKAIRGGTDGSRLSYMGLPCPNIFAGGHNFHGPYEYVPVRSMVKAVEVVIRICEKVVHLKDA
ncbi:peptidase T [Sunxiuqinia elliptica]|uniref:Peptidase T n=1 Tax=Sunxiuqinia elliptica TaxID=655355 RepID=A0A4R6GYB1_9BACT|nr:peptidase T [Sunxiuqinia elliptica]TDO00001.1 peptidase T [Sunxiuqinia elliptica]TDO57192.1 peptidase T [Sunxiuqinia elliptica]